MLTMIICQRRSRKKNKQRKRDICLKKGKKVVGQTGRTSAYFLGFKISDTLQK